MVFGFLFCKKDVFGGDMTKGDCGWSVILKELSRRLFEPEMVVLDPLPDNAYKQGKRKMMYKYIHLITIYLKCILKIINLQKLLDIV